MTKRSSAKGQEKEKLSMTHSMSRALKLNKAEMSWLRFIQEIRNEC